jgi:lysozyme family protein
MGPITMAKIWEKSKTGDAEFARAILNKQIERYQKDEQAATYGEGWTNRVEKIKDTIS